MHLFTHICYGHVFSSKATVNFLQRAIRWVIALVFCLLVPPLLSHAASKPEHISHEIAKPEQRDNDRHERVSKSSRRLIEAFDHGEDITTQLDTLDADSDEIENENKEHLKKFEETGRKLRAIGGLSTILSRHEQALLQFRQKSGELKEHFQKIKKAKRNKATPTEITGRVKTLHDYLEKHRPRKEFDIKSTGSGLPWRMVQPGDLQILGDISQASQQGEPAASSPPVSVDDLSATIDVQITPEIQALAASLHNSPLEIFRYVYNNYDYTLYYGSMKGSLDTYWEKEGNSYDLSSLLISLLRASNVPARYVRAEIIVPIHNIQAWLGIDDPLSAAQYLASAKIPCSFYTSGSSISHVQLQHIYVEAYIPYGNYRGTGEDDKGKAWVPMDPSFKKYKVMQAGVDFSTAMTFDWKSFSSDYLGTLQNITPLNHYNNRINDYITTNYPDKSIDDLKRKTELSQMKFDFLPNTLPYKTYSIIERYSAIPPNQRHSIRFIIPEVLDYSTTLPEISGRRITLTFTGATTEDQATIDSYGGIFHTPPYLVKVIPILRINGNQVAQGSSQDAGTMTPFSVTHSHPDGTQDPFNHNVMTGSQNAVGLTTGKVRPEYLSIAEVEPSDEVYLPKMLHSLSMKYHDALSQTRQTLNETMRMQSRTFLTEALVSTHEERTLVLGGTPTSFTLEGFKIDAKEVSMAAMPVDGKEITKKQIDFAMTFGFEASYQENRVFEDSMFWVEGTSAVKGLQMLKAFGIQLDELEPHTTYENVNLPTSVVTDINNALNMGWRVIAPQETGGLLAVPYIKYDEKTGSAGFMIAAAAGGLANEIIDMTWVKDLWLKLCIKFSYEIKYPQSPFLVAMGDAFEIIMKTTAGYADGIKAETESNSIINTDSAHYKSGQWPMYSLIPGSYKYQYDGKELFKFNVWNVMVKQPKNAVKISSNLEMPELVLTADLVGAELADINIDSVQVCWSGKLEYYVNTIKDPNRSRKGLDPSGAGKGKDGFKIPVPNPPQLSSPDCGYGINALKYKVDWKNAFGGGKLSITPEVSYYGRPLKGAAVRTYELVIEGQTFSEDFGLLSKIKSYLSNPDSDASVPTLRSDVGFDDVFKVIAYHESMHTYSHYSKSKYGTPKGVIYVLEAGNGDGGFGIMQLTIPPPSYLEIWNWKEHINKSVRMLKEKLIQAKKYPEKVRNMGCTSLPYKNKKGNWVYPCRPITDIYKNAEDFEPDELRWDMYCLYNSGSHYWKWVSKLMSGLINLRGEWKPYSDAHVPPQRSGFNYTNVLRKIETDKKY